MFRSLHDSCLPLLLESRRTTVACSVRTAILSAIFALCFFLASCGSSNSTQALQVNVANSANPLVAQVTIGSGCTGQVMVEFGPDTSYGRSTSWYPIDSAPITVQVAGMRASTVYHMRAQRQCLGVTTTSQDTVFTAGAPPSIPFPAVQVSRSDPPDSTENPGVELLDTIATTGTNQIQAFVTDRDGNPIWYYDVGQGKFPYIYKLLPNGNFLFMIVDPQGAIRGSGKWTWPATRSVRSTSSLFNKECRPRDSISFLMVITTTFFFWTTAMSSFSSHRRKSSSTFPDIPARRRLSEMDW